MTMDWGRDPFFHQNSQQPSEYYSFRSPRVASIVRRVMDERKRQNEIWGEQNHTDEFWYCIAGEEFGEVAKAIFERNGKDIDTELIHVIAVCVQWLEARKRR